MALRITKRLILLISCGFLLFALIGWKKQPSVQSGLEPPRAMWVWDIKIFQDRDATVRLLDFCTEKNINLLFYTAYKVTGAVSDDYRRLNHLAHKRGISVQALAGDPRWCLQKYQHRALQWAADVIKFNAEASEDERFDGIHSDVEPYLLGKLWETDRQGLLVQYLDMNKGIEEMLRSFAPKFVFAADIPFWYDDDPTMWVKWQNTFSPPSYHILNIADQIVIMDYRDFAEGENGSILLAKNEIKYADTVGKKVYIGQETQPDLYPDYITFGNKDAGYMEDQIAKLVCAYKDNPSFAGIAIHHYLSYKRLLRKSGALK